MASVVAVELTIESLRAALEEHEGNVTLLVSGELTERALECAEGFGRVTVGQSVDLAEGEWAIASDGEDIDFGAAALERDPTWSDAEWEYQQRRHADRLESDRARVDRETAQAQAELDAEDGGSRLAGLEAEAGPAVGEMPPSAREDAPVPPDKIFVVGTQQTGARKWAGKVPGSVVIALKGLKFEVDGSFKKGDRFKFEGEALVISEGAKDKLDKETRTVSEAVQMHDAIVLDFATVVE